MFNDVVYLFVLSFCFVCGFRCFYWGAAASRPPRRKSRRHDAMRRTSRERGNGLGWMPRSPRREGNHDVMLRSRRPGIGPGTSGKKRITTSCCDLGGLQSARETRITTSYCDPGAVDSAREREFTTVCCDLRALESAPVPGGRNRHGR